MPALCRAFVIMSKKKVATDANATIAVNRRASFEYYIEERIEAGIVLQGWEVKSLRAGKGNLSDAYVLFKNGEAFLFGSQITPLLSASTHVVPDPTATRKLLLKKSELNKLVGAVSRKGYAVIATRLYWKDNRVKVEIALARGKQDHDKRDTEKDREWAREKERTMKKNVR